MLNQYAGQEETKDLLQMIGFTVGDELFGVDILMVREIIRETTITPIPKAPSFIEGVINLRGSIIPVIDLRKRLKRSDQDHFGTDIWIVILTVEGRITGFIVDRVTRFCISRRTASNRHPISWWPL